MVAVYRIFTRDTEHELDFSEDMLYEMYNAESSGGTCSHQNGYYHGKKWMDVAVKMWREDLSKGNLFLIELYDDPVFPDWWLDKLFGKKPVWSIPQPDRAGESEPE
jgi:hypothetical protein